MGYCAFEEIQNTQPQNMLLWHIDYFDLEEIEKQQMQKGRFDLSFSFPVAGYEIPIWRMLSLHQEEGDEESRPREIGTNRPC